MIKGVEKRVLDVGRYSDGKNDHDKLMTVVILDDGVAVGWALDSCAYFFLN